MVMPKIFVAVLILGIVVATGARPRHHVAEPPAKVVFGVTAKT